MLVALAAAGGCGAPGPELTFADWILPLAEDIPVREYAPIAIEDRDPDAVRLVEDLVIGGDPSDPNGSFYQPMGVAASPSGDIFVLERGNRRIQMFDHDGTFLASLGGPGQGPGELQFPVAIGIAGDRLVVHDGMNARLSFWTLDGTHVEDHVPSTRFPASGFEALPDGSLMISHGERNPDGSRTRIIERRSIQGEPLTRFLAVPGEPAPTAPVAVSDRQASLQQMLDLTSQPSPQLAVGKAGLVYITPLLEYQVLVFDDAGEPLWALRSAWPRPPYPESQKQEMLEAYSQDGAEIDADRLRWPELDRSVRAIRTDGEGRLYVFLSPGEAAPAGERFLVDVYSPDGELLAAGFTRSIWQHAVGDDVYELRRDPVLDEMVVVRYRLAIDER